MDKLELQKLRDLPIEGVAERLGLRVDSHHKCLCPFHADHNASMSFHRGRNTYRCFVCGAHGGTIDMVMNHLRLDFKAACRWLADEHNIILEEWKPREKETEVRTFDASRYERFFVHPWLSDDARRFLFDERHIDPRVVSWCRLTSWRDRDGVAWLQTPYYDVEGRLIGVQNRNLLHKKEDENEDKREFSGSQQLEASPLLGERVGLGRPRFKFPYGSQCSIYNLPVLHLLRPGEELWITEGCSDCWAMLSSGRKAIAIPSATLLKPKDVELLLSLHSERSTVFHMYPDRDAPGEKLFLQLQEKLSSHKGAAEGDILVHHQLPKGCKDFADYYLRNLH